VTFINKDLVNRFLRLFYFYFYFLVYPVLILYRILSVSFCIKVMHLFGSCKRATFIIIAICRRLRVHLRGFVLNVLWFYNNWLMNGIEPDTCVKLKLFQAQNAPRQRVFIVREIHWKFEKNQVIELKFTDHESSVSSLLTTD